MTKCLKQGKQKVCDFGLSMESARSERIQGALLGLVAGDKIGGPSRMAIVLGDSLLALGCFDPDDVIVRYKGWYDREGFDTGRVAAMVFENMATLSNEEAVRGVDDSLGGLTAGCNPAHRALALALLPFIDDSSLISVAESEALLTHRHPLAGAVSGAFLSIVRRLITGSGVEVFDLATICKPEGLLHHYFGENRNRDLQNGGFAPDVLRAAMHFAGIAESFDEAIDSAVRFAGPSNYCPVLVGAMAGARWGVQSIDQRHLVHCPRDHLERARQLSAQMSRAWAWGSKCID